MQNMYFTVKDISLFKMSTSHAPCKNRNLRIGLFPQYTTYLLIDMCKYQTNPKNDFPNLADACGNVSSTIYVQVHVCI
jgi:hypothetical protein